MILSQPGASSAQPSGLLPGPCNHRTMPPRIMPLVLGEARESWMCPTGGAEHTRSSLLMVLMDAAPISTAAVASSRPGRMPRRLLGMDRAGGVLHQKVNKGPHIARKDV